MKREIFQLFGALVIAFFVMPSLSAAQSKPVNVALVTPIQIFPESNSMMGLRINLIYGKNVSMEGLDWGLVNAVGSGGFTGVELGLANICDGNALGVQWSAVNLTKGNVKGVQWGWFNSGGHVSGLQFGLVNYEGSMYGLQIGLINIIKTGGFMPVFPIVNFSF